MDAPKDAINNINKLLASINDNKLTSFEFVMDDCDWLEAAKSALEKQIPSKLRKKEIAVGNTIYKRYYCPSCRSLMFVEIEDETGFVNSGKRRIYCDNCGKALKWDK